jgi:hypothetical protein
MLFSSLFTLFDPAVELVETGVVTVHMHLALASLTYQVMNSSGAAEPW